LITTLPTRLLVRQRTVSARLMTNQKAHWLTCLVGLFVHRVPTVISLHSGSDVAATATVASLANASKYHHADMLSSEQVFTFTGSDQYYYTQGHTQFLVKAYGAGGGNFLRSGTEGGVGGYAEAVIIVPAGTDRLTVVVGEAGATWGDDSSPDPCYHNAFGGGGRSACDGYNTAGSGGGRSSVRLDGEDILTAGGGGGGSGKWAASVECKGPGGSGGGEAGGTDCDSSLLSGRGGTASAGGAGGVGIERTGGAGGKYKGGDGSSSSGWSGGGGGGGFKGAY